VLEATSIDLDELKEYNLPIIIDFGADSCVSLQGNGSRTEKR
jgi:thioredoxin 1